MAKQVGPHFFIGTIGDLVFYQQGDQYYVRKKSAYNKKKMQKPGAYPLMQLKQGEFGQASRLASKVYRMLPRKQKKQGLFGQFTKTARQFLKEGKTHEEVVASLRSLYLVEKEPVAIQPEQTVIAQTSVDKNGSLVSMPIDTSAPSAQSLPSNAMFINGLWYVPVTTKSFLSPPIDQLGSIISWDKKS